MRPEPANDNQTEIANRIDAKAAIVAEARDHWSPEGIAAEMKFAVPFKGSVADDEFATAYAKWQRINYQDLKVAHYLQLGAKGPPEASD
jgi:hypothetical protein